MEEIAEYRTSTPEKIFFDSFWESKIKEFKASKDIAYDAFLEGVRFGMKEIEKMYAEKRRLVKK